MFEQAEGVGIVIHSSTDIRRLRAAGRAAAATLRAVAQRLRPGISTAQVNQWVRADTLARGGIPSQFGHEGFPACVCTSRNHVACHGIPSPREILSEGDILNVDVTTLLDGFHGDTSETFFIGQPGPEARHVVEVARQCRDLGIGCVRDGARLGDIGAVISEFAHAQGCSVVREFTGHGIGRQMHAAPSVPHVGVRGTGTRLRTGMALTIEPIINLGAPDVVMGEDGWTVFTKDGSWSAQFEHTLVVTHRGCEILTCVDSPRTGERLSGNR